MNTRRLLQAGLGALCVLFALWFAPRRDWVALAIFALPPLLCLMATRHAGNARFWSGVLALGWFSHGVMVAWTRPAERSYALVEVVLSLAVVLAASLPGLRSRFARRRH